MANRLFDLIVWNKAMDLLVETYELVALLPKEEKYSLGDQMRRAAVSIPSNIAEGKARCSSNEFKHFLSVARGSAAELETQFLICIRVNYMNEGQLENVLALCDEIERMLTSLINNLPSD